MERLRLRLFCSSKCLHIASKQALTLVWGYSYSVLAVQRDLDKTVGPAMMDLAVEVRIERWFSSCES